MDCGRRSAVDDDRSRKTSLAFDDDRRQGRWAVDDARSQIAFYQAQSKKSLDQVDRNIDRIRETLRSIRRMRMSSATIPRHYSSSASRKRRQSRHSSTVIDDYPPLELPLKWRDPPPLQFRTRVPKPPPVPPFASDSKCSFEDDIEQPEAHIVSNGDMNDDEDSSSDLLDREADADSTAAQLIRTRLERQYSIPLDSPIPAHIDPPPVSPIKPSRSVQPCTTEPDHLRRPCLAQVEQSSGFTCSHPAGPSLHSHNQDPKAFSGFFRAPFAESKTNLVGLSDLNADPNVRFRCLRPAALPPDPANLRPASTLADQKPSTISLFHSRRSRFPVASVSSSTPPFSNRISEQADDGAGLGSVISPAIDSIALILTSVALSLSLLLVDVHAASAFVVSTPRKLQSDELATVAKVQGLEMAVFTATGENEALELDAAVVWPGRIDFQIHFPRCDFTAFKMMAGSYLDVTKHKLYVQVEFQSGGKQNNAELEEILMASRCRTIKNLISTMQQSVSLNLATVKNKEVDVISVQVGICSIQPLYLGEATTMTGTSHKKDRASASIQPLVEEVVDNDWEKAPLATAVQFAKGRDRRNGDIELIDNYFVIVGVKMPDINSSDKADSTQRSQTVRRNVNKGCDLNLKLSSYAYGPTTTIEEQGIKELDMRPGGISSFFLITELKGCKEYQLESEKWDFSIASLVSCASSVRPSNDNFVLFDHDIASYALDNDGNDVPQELVKKVGELFERILEDANDENKIFDPGICLLQQSLLQ